MKKSARHCKLGECLCNQAKLHQGKRYCKIMMRLVSDIPACPIKTQKGDS